MKVASIGPITSATARARGLSVVCGSDAARPCGIDRGNSEILRRLIYAQVTPPARCRGRAPAAATLAQGTRDPLRFSHCCCANSASLSETVHESLESALTTSSRKHRVDHAYQHTRPRPWHHFSKDRGEASSPSGRKANQRTSACSTLLHEELLKWSRTISSTNHCKSHSGSVTSSESSTTSLPSLPRPKTASEEAEIGAIEARGKKNLGKCHSCLGRGVSSAWK